MSEEWGAADEERSRRNSWVGGSWSPGLQPGVYDDLGSELELRTPYDPNFLLAGKAQTPYSLPRGLIESVDGGSHVFVSEGVLTQQQVQGPQGVTQNAIHDQRSFEGWRYREA